MDDDEVADFLSRNTTLRLATISPDGYPHNVPVGYIYRADKIYFPSDSRSRKTSNIESNPKVGCVIDEGTAGDDPEHLKGVLVQGIARIYGETEHPLVSHEDVLQGIFAPGEVKGRNHYEKVERVVVEVDPETTVAWDFGKVY